MNDSQSAHYRRRHVESRRTKANAYGTRRHGAAAIGARRHLARIVVADSLAGRLCAARRCVMLHHRRRPDARSLVVLGTHEIARDEIEVQKQHPG
jgi:hypothetical protein